jgi:hypothetical protein
MGGVGGIAMIWRGLEVDKTVVFPLRSHSFPRRSNVIPDEPLNRQGYVIYHNSHLSVCTSPL